MSIRTTINDVIGPKDNPDRIEIMVRLAAITFASPLALGFALLDGELTVSEVCFVLTLAASAVVVWIWMAGQTKREKTRLKNIESWSRAIDREMEQLGARKHGVNLFKS